MQYELKKCQDQTGMKNDKLDDKTSLAAQATEIILGNNIVRK